MPDPVVLCVAVLAARLAYQLVLLCMSPARDRLRAEVLATLLRSAGPGGVAAVKDRDGSVMLARAELVKRSPR